MSLMQSFILQLSTNTQSFTLIRNTAAEPDNKTITLIPLNLLKLENYMLLLLAQYLNDNAVVPKDLKKTSIVYRDFAIIAPRNIDSKIDSENIIPEGMKRTKKQKY